MASPTWSLVIELRGSSVMSVHMAHDARNLPEDLKYCILSVMSACCHET